MLLAMQARPWIERALRRIGGGLDVLMEEIPEPKPGEDLITSGETGTCVISADRSQPQWHGLAGLLAGRFWLFFAKTGAPRYREAAARVSRMHRRGWSSLINESFAARTGPAMGFELTADEDLRELALTTCREVKAGFWEPLELFLRWPAGPGRPSRAEGPWGAQLQEYVATVDDTAGASVLYWADRFEPGLRDAVLRSQRALRRHGAIAGDGTVTQAVSAALVEGRAARVQLGAVQGTARWTRAQAWGVLSSVAAFEVTGQGEFLDDARACVDFYRRECLSGDSTVPIYDRLAGDPATAPRDTCSAAIVASALVRLVQREPRLAGEYSAFVERTFIELVEGHMTVGGTVLHGCWGNLRTGPREVIMPFGNYYLIEALMRCVLPDHPIWAALP
jgi:hypothetical protein